MRRTLAFVALSMMLMISRPSVGANTFGTDYSDLWWNPNESGWGVTLTHQSNAIFATLFVHAPDRSAHWYSGAAFSSGTSRFTGQFFEGSGPWFGSAFNPALASSRQVGTVTLDLPFVNSGTMTYTVDGVTVVKSIQRQTFLGNNMTGRYLGAAIGSASGCSTSGSFENVADFTVAHAGSSISITALVTNGIASNTCSYTGTYTQSGRMGTITGTGSCSNGSRSTFTAFELEASYQAFFTRYTADYGGGCTETGRIGGMKRS